MSEPTSAQTDHGPPPTRPRRSRGAIAAVTGAALVVGAGLGLGVGYLIFGGGPDAATSDHEALAASHVEYACQVIERIDERDITIEELGDLDEEPLYSELPAAAQLLSAAAILDPQYEELGEAGAQTLRNFHSFVLEDLTGDASTACADR